MSPDRTNDPQLSHVDSEGAARMVDVGAKPVTERRAVAQAKVLVGREVAEAILQNSLKKGDLLQVARLGGIAAAKRTSDLVLLCHPLTLHHVEVDARLEGQTVLITASVSSAGPTGVEMEALAAATGAALNVFDMGKALNPGIQITDVRVIDKRGGKTPPPTVAQHDISVALLVVSDSRSAGEQEDRATPALTEAVSLWLGASVRLAAIVPDERAAIESRLREWIELSDPPQIIFTSGGTGVGPRDVTPEATAAVVQRLHPGLLELARARCLPGKPHAFLSRAIAGVARQTLVINLPGSPGGAADMVRLLSDVLPHAVKAMSDPATLHPPA
ncbi:bifunctional molybdenum cofactor biosynthesis protein MoaC/MoaB [Botrimarina sp.]|uniref:bifunctional molybdenum cofactor biosynthesis protein MoaC/MoaB n=1 Tax=Botrimarina sp. TaxID=2795802 RepID=UPI0032EB0AF3